MRPRLVQFDWVIFGSLLILLVLGLTIIRSVAPELFFSQLIYAILGLILFFFLARLDYQIFLSLGKVFYFGAVFLLVLTFLFGAMSRGAVRWLQIGRFTLQPSELVKPLLILAFASFLTLRPITSFKDWLRQAWWLAWPILLIFFQPDLGSSLVVFLVWLTIIFAAGFPLRFLALAGLLGLILLPLTWFILQPYQRARVTTFLSPFADPLGSGYNIIQAMIAVGSGQIFGRGLGRGTQSHLRFLPEHHTDFIFASLSEELGFLGALALIVAYGLLLWRLLSLARKQTDPFGRLICLGVFGMILAQFFINVGMNLGLLPITGITLPLVSYGGSSLFSSLISLGIVENIARFNYNGQRGQR